MALNKRADEGVFASILADGKIHISVPEGTEGSVVRVYETSDGKTGSKTEMVYDDVVGKITKLSFRDGEYGTSLNVEITDGEEKPIVLSLGTASNFGEDMMKKLLNINMDKYVKIAPFAFIDENGKNKRGVTIFQKDENNKSYKIENHFYDKETKLPINGYPETPVPKKGKTLTSDDWKLFFGIARKFMIEKITEHFKLDDTVEDTAQSEVDAW